MSKLPITQVAITDLSDMLNPTGGRRMDLPGFDPEFVDFPDYIIRITHWIWHDDPDRPRDVELCHKYYAPNCLVHTMSGNIHGVQTVIDNTYATMKAFPDRVLDADNVVWSNDGPQKDDFQDSDNPVFYSSHRITSKMTNLGESEFGPATGKKIKVITVADCACRDNVIFEEWIVRDYASVVMQMGNDIDAVARKLAKEDIENNFNLIEFHAENRQRTLANAPSSAPPPAEPEMSPGDFMESYFHHIWSEKDSSKLSDYYDFRVDATYPGLRNFYGHDEVWGYLKDLFSAIPDATVSVDHVADIPYLGDARDVAVRWSLTGTHSGDGLYGPASGAPVYILGISHFRIIRGRIHQEVAVWDDIALRRMIEGARLRT